MFVTLAVLWRSKMHDDNRKFRARVKKFTSKRKRVKKLILDYCVLGNLLKSAPSARKAISSGELRVLRDFAKT